MYSRNYVHIGLAVATALMVASCGGSSSGDALFGGGDGGPGGGGGGGGTGGGGTVTIEPRLTTQLVNPGAELFGLAIAGNAERAVYVSDDDPLGSNPTGGEQIFAISFSNGEIRQLTDVAETATVEFQNFDITDNGDQVVFTTTADLVAGSNPNNLAQVFRAATDGTGIVQVTSLTAGFATDPQISGDGSLIVFRTEEDLTGGNPMNFAQIFSILPDGSNIVQITTGNQMPTNLVLSENRQTVAYDSQEDPFGTNADTTREIFSINTDGTNHMQLTNSPGFSFNPQISEDGAWVVFASSADLVAGGNTDGNFDVFVASTDGTTLTQITANARNSGKFASDAPGAVDISAAGDWVAFASDADLTGDNPDGTHTIFWSSRDATQMGQYLRDGTVNPTVLERSADNPQITNDGQGILFNSSANYTLDSNGTGKKIYTHIRQ